MAKRKRNARLSDSPQVMPSGESDKWRAQGDCDTLVRAEEIKRDKKRHAAAKAHAREHAGNLKAVISPRERYARIKDVEL